jgi:peptide/nickel transport system permease protein
VRVSGNKVEMIAFVAKRLATGVMLIFALTLATYTVFFLIPIDPGYIALGNPRASQAERLRIDHELGLDKPVAVQYGHFAWNLLRHGRLGHPFASDVSLNHVIALYAPPTASLVLGGALVLLALSIPLALISATRPRSVVDRGILAVSVIGIALHPFVLGLVVRGVLANRLHLTPSSGYCPLFGQNIAVPQTWQEAPAGCGGPGAWASHLVLPWLVFALFFLPIYARMFRARLVDTLSMRYITTARAKGASEWRVFWAHALRNAVVPILPMVAMDVGTALTAAIYVETIFGLNGLGILSLNALSGETGGYDLPTINAVVFTVAATVVVLNVLADIVLVALDPRITGRSGGPSLRRRVQRVFDRNQGLEKRTPASADL